MGNECIFLGIPSLNGLQPQTAMALLKFGDVNVPFVRVGSTSLLTQCFNQLWCMALNERSKGITHFVMMHDDIGPVEVGWLEQLFRIKEEHKADVVGVVSPIKDHRGITSTGVLNPDKTVIRKFTMRELAKLPPTFDAAGAGYPECSLMINTGLWICDFTQPWVEQICFTMRERIVKNMKGEFLPQCVSEDWCFSHVLNQLGLKVMLTQEVKITHHGKYAFPNYAEWGSWEQDQSCSAAFDLPEPELDVSELIGEASKATEVCV